MTTAASIQARSWFVVSSRPINAASRRRKGFGSHSGARQLQGGSEMVGVGDARSLFPPKSDRVAKTLSS
jgi:hypothetical protein